MRVQLDLKEDRARVLDVAQGYVDQEPITITAFHSPRSAGGVHDFFSEGDYWWPNPDDPSGPYIQRDGLTNPDNFVEHRHAMVRLSIHVATLVAAFKIIGDERYARQAIRHLRAWFIDEATRMNPHLEYAQAIQGKSVGRGIGIIDTVHLVEVARSVTVLEKATVLGGQELRAIKGWFAEYVAWMATSKNGRHEMNAKNNHGTCWVMQVAAFENLIKSPWRTLRGSLTTWLRREPKIPDSRARFKKVLLPNQMAADGGFPRELDRTKPYNYSLFNLDAMATICQILSKPNDNLWTYTTADGRSLRQAFEFMYPYIADKAAWPYAQDVMGWDDLPVRSPALLFAGLAYDDPKYLDLWQTLDANPTNAEVLRNLPIRQPVLWVD